VRGLGFIKEASAKANLQLGVISQEIADPIIKASIEVRDGLWDAEFAVDAIQGGAGTSTNMNANEVVANRALEIAGFRKGDYDKIHPLNHVNASQSTNDVYPTAIKVALIIESLALLKRVEYLRESINAKALEFKDVIKMGRTQLQDAVPDVMLLDIEMPRMDGFELTRTMRGEERWRGIPIVMITSRTAEKHRNHALGLGVDVFLGKPFDEVELLRNVRELVARRQPAL
jgi:CheY-like chemotaxis protein